MAVESKPLFHPEVIRQQVRSFKLPERVAELQPRLQHWADLITCGRADDFKETDLLPDFITDIFCNLLGYTRPAGPSDTFTLSREAHVEVDGKFADAVLGRFHKDRKEFLVALEGKGARDPLERVRRAQAQVSCHKIPRPEKPPQNPKPLHFIGFNIVSPPNFPYKRSRFHP